MKGKLEEAETLKKSEARAEALNGINPTIRGGHPGRSPKSVNPARNPNEKRPKPWQRLAKKGFRSRVKRHK